ncbi:MAG: amidase [Candidatus Helarchaeota archaeon]|nr:amidase [Candidatus Helarchaeota archaeon]
MRKEDICFMSACDMVEKIESQELTSVEATEVIIERIEKINPIINAYCTLTFDLARETAKNADKAVKKGEKLGLLHGIPTSIKDELETKGIRSTFGSKIFENYIPTEDDVAVARLKDAGIVMLGKTNLPPFGYAPITTNLIFGATKNPWNLGRTPGGSSGGAAAAVAAGLGPLAIGGDGGGSIRVPCSFCGTYGIKPNFGRVPHLFSRLGGAISTFTQNGPIVRYVKDAALMLDVIVGEDDSDKLSIPKPNYSFLEKMQERPPKKLKLGYALNLAAKILDSEVEKCILNGLEKFEQFGWDVEESDLIDLAYSKELVLGRKLPKIRDVFMVLGIIWASSFYYVLDAMRLLKDWEDKIDPVLAQMVKLGKQFSAKDIKRAEIQIEMICNNIARHFKKYDILITPTVGRTAIGIDKTLFDTVEIDGQKVGTSEWLSYTYPFNMSGHPAASIPCGWHSDGLPIGMQIVGKRFDEVSVLQVSKAFEEVSPWQDKRPTFNS